MSEINNVQCFFTAKITMIWKQNRRKNAATEPFS